MYGARRPVRRGGLPFAHGTSVTAEKTRYEIETTLTRYGADGTAIATAPGKARVEFTAKARRVRFDLMLPPAGTSKNDAETRRLWRALLLGIKSKLEVVRSGIAVFEDEFMSHIVMPDGQTVGQHVRPAIETAYKTGKVGPLLLAAGDTK